MTSKKCCSCKNDVELVLFGNNKSNADGKQTYCKPCGRLRDKACYRKNPDRRNKIKQARLLSQELVKDYIIQYLEKHPCVDCGESNPLFLDFDHISHKVIEISNAIKNGWSLNKIKEEIEKCQVRCLKCHRIKTAKQFGWFDKYEKYFTSIR